MAIIELTHTCNMPMLIFTCFFGSNLLKGKRVVTITCKKKNIFTLHYSLQLDISASTVMWIGIFGPHVSPAWNNGLFVHGSVVQCACLSP